MAEPITKPRLAEVVEKAVRDLPADAAPMTVAQRVTNDPAIAPALKPISRLNSEVIQGVSGIGVVQLLNAFGVTETLVIAAGWFGQTWNPAQVSTVLTTVISLALAAYAWYGRETTTRPLA